MLGAFSSQGQSKLFVIMRCPYYKRVSVERGLAALACSSISFLEIVDRAYGNKNRRGELLTAEAGGWHGLGEKRIVCR